MAKFTNFVVKFTTLQENSAEELHLYGLGQTIIFLEGGGGDEKFSSANNFVLIYASLQSFFSNSTFPQTFFFLQHYLLFSTRLFIVNSSIT